MEPWEIVMRRAVLRRRQADGLEQRLRDTRSSTLGSFALNEPRGWQDVLALRVAASELECAALELKNGG